MAKKAKKRREWTKADVRDLKSAARQKTPAAKIARALKRTVGATRESGELPASNLRLAYPANNLPSSVSDRDIKKVVREFYATHFRKSSV
jgi:hypothetical protein